MTLLQPDSSQNTRTDHRRDDHSELPKLGQLRTREEAHHLVREPLDRWRDVGFHAGRSDEAEHAGSWVNVGSEAFAEKVGGGIRGSGEKEGGTGFVGEELKAGLDKRHRLARTGRSEDDEGGGTAGFVEDCHDGFAARR